MRSLGSPGIAFGSVSWRSRDHWSHGDLGSIREISVMSRNDVWIGLSEVYEPLVSGTSREHSRGLREVHGVRLGRSRGGLWSIGLRDV